MSEVISIPSYAKESYIFVAFTKSASIFGFQFVAVSYLVDTFSFPSEEWKVVLKGDP